MVAWGLGGTILFAATEIRKVRVVDALGVKSRSKMARPADVTAGGGLNSI